MVVVGVDGRKSSTLCFHESIRYSVDNVRRSLALETEDFFDFLADEKPKYAGSR